MDPQIKKGSLEMCVLMMLKKKDCYGYEVSKEIGDLLDVKEGTIYLVLQRLERTTYVDSYLQESKSNKTRKYYRITKSGLERMQQLVDDYSTINKVIDNFMSQTKKEDTHE
ncbi:PadR family transcriptional regulator PadR [Bacilli bacterium PM5-3]|nr:PadR family transcriptional regulator PadR [Bacilli bacterium PM5-3]MDH6603419.1 PadR family transcriptional regulator PadR [Bacilli bacterium PM5-9]